MCGTRLGLALLLLLLALCRADPESREQAAFLRWALKLAESPQTASSTTASRMTDLPAGGGVKDDVPGANALRRKQSLLNSHATLIGWLSAVLGPNLGKTIFPEPFPKCPSREGAALSAIDLQWLIRSLDISRAEDILNPSLLLRSVASPRFVIKLYRHSILVSDGHPGAIVPYATAPEWRLLLAQGGRQLTKALGGAKRYGLVITLAEQRSRLLVRGISNELLVLVLTALDAIDGYCRWWPVRAASRRAEILLQSPVVYVAVVPRFALNFGLLEKAVVPVQALLDPSQSAETLLSYSRGLFDPRETKILLKYKVPDPFVGDEQVKLGGQGSPLGVTLDQICPLFQRVQIALPRPPPPPPPPSSAPTSRGSKQEALLGPHHKQGPAPINIQNRPPGYPIFVDLTGSDHPTAANNDKPPHPLPRDQSNPPGVVQARRYAP